MKPLRIVLLQVIFLASAFPQGPLTPPGGPAPTMKSLDQIEARTPISSVPFTISQSGSYYLTNNVTVASGNAITINASGVTLDLNGFTISSTASNATGAAISIFGANVAVRNGSISSGVTVSGGNFSGSGFVDGIVGIFPNVHVSGIHVYGCLGNGISLGGSSSQVVESCTVQIAGSYGIYASVVRDSTARTTGLGIVADEISNSDAEAIASGASAILASRAAQNCFGVSSSGFGVVSNATVQNCFGVSNSGTGLSGFTVQNCYGTSNAGTALNGVTVTNCYASNSSAPNAAITAVTVQNSYGYNIAGTAILATYAVDNSVGYSSTGGVAISATNVTNSYAVGTNGGVITGISADVVQNSAVNLSSNGTGITAGVVQNSAALITGNATANGTGMVVTGEASHCQVFNSGNNKTFDGIFAGDGAVVKNCDIQYLQNGIKVAGNDCVIEGNNLHYNTIGIHVTGSECRIDGNRLDSPPGHNALVFDGASNLIIRNAVRENGTNPFVFNVSGNHYGPLVSVTGATDISAVTHGSDPWANFIY